MRIGTVAWRMTVTAAASLVAVALVPGVAGAAQDGEI